MVKYSAKKKISPLNLEKQIPSQQSGTYWFENLPSSSKPVWLIKGNKTCFGRVRRLSHFQLYVIIPYQDANLWKRLSLLLTFFMHLQGWRENQRSLNEDLWINYNIVSCQGFQEVKICQMEGKWIFLLGTMQDSASRNNLWKIFSSLSEAARKAAENVLCSVVSHTWFPLWSSHTSFSNPIAHIFSWNCRDCCQIFPFQMQDFDNSTRISKKVLYFQAVE